MGEEVEYVDGSGYTFETILSGNEVVIGIPSYVKGYYRLYEDGMALYYSREDCVYDTRENAIWIPRERTILRKMIKSARESLLLEETNQLQQPSISSMN